MQPLFDLAPLLAFLLAYYLGGIYVATMVLMASMVALVLLDLARARRVSPMHLISAVLVLLLGGTWVALSGWLFAAFNLWVAIAAALVGL